VTAYGHGLIIGKFYPPHRGHHEMIRAAAAQSLRVTVVVMASHVETIALADRVDWLRAEHAGDRSVTVVGVRCDAPLDVSDERVWVAQVAVMRAAIRTVTDIAVDAVFSSDEYGQELAARFDAKWVRVFRAAGAPSGTAIRADLAAGWADLASATRASLATRVVVVGAESTGTTTVAALLTEHYRGRGGAWASTQRVAEFGREYTDQKWAQARLACLDRGEPAPALDELRWCTDDFDVVAQEQTRLECLAATDGSPVLFCDTDAFATSIWERRYLAGGSRAGQPWAIAPQLPRHDLYLVTDHEQVPWSDDGMREGDLAIRAAMTCWFIDALVAVDQSFVLLTGTLQERLGLAVRTVDQLLASRMLFAAPVTGPGFESAQQ
jgi:HTH-type transcriptional regulator, transcriptional repressor of NAD biosynthesis genes